MPRPAPDEYDHTILSLATGDLLSQRYRLVREIGRGGMGIVWLAEDTTLDDRQIALKLLPSVLSQDKRSISRLKAEAVRNLDLTHPHIVRLINFEQDESHGDMAYLVMQYVKGESLNDLLADHLEGIPLKRVLKWAEQIAAAIDYAHEQGVLHRDIKPSNIMIDGKDNAYLMDFGIAREAKDTMTRVTGRDSSGTLPYMSPQHVDGQNHKSNDIYSFAATLYEALSGEPPFTTGDLINQIKHIPVQSISRQPDHVNQALLSGLAKQNNDRPETARSLTIRLTSPPPPPPPPPPKPTPIPVPEIAEPAPQLAPTSRSQIQPTKNKNGSGSPVARTIVAVFVATSALLGVLLFILSLISSDTTTQRTNSSRSSDSQSRPTRIDQSNPSHGDRKTIDLGGGVQITFVYIEPDRFQMGSHSNDEDRFDDEGPQHWVTISTGYWLGETEVTQTQWSALMKTKPWSMSSWAKEGGVNAASYVSWNDAKSFCDQLSRLHNGTFRLPSEAEWEFACRAGSTKRFSFGNSDADFGAYAWYAENAKYNGERYAHAVRKKKANAWGLYDMHGNVSEWCADVWHDNYEGAPTDGSVWSRGGDSSRHVLRSGSWRSIPRLCRSANRYGSRGSRSEEFPLNGFRVAMDLN